MNSGVPNSVPSAVSVSSPIAFASPKSAIIARPLCPSSKIFAGLMSRWIMPRACAAARPRATSRPIRIVSVAGNRPTRFRPISQGLARHELHHQKRRIVSHIDRVDRHDVLVRDRRRRLRLAQESALRRFAHRRHRRKHLDRHQPLEHAVVRLKHHTHAAATDHAANLISAKLAEILRTVRRRKKWIPRRSRARDLSRVGTRLRHRTQRFDRAAQCRRIRTRSAARTGVGRNHRFHARQRLQSLAARRTRGQSAARSSSPLPPPAYQ